MPAGDDTFRQSMRLLAGGVTIVTSAFESKRSGLTATAVCSLALAPPRILVSINVQGNTYQLVSRSRCMSVNLLARDHEYLAERFAAKRAALDEDSLLAVAVHAGVPTYGHLCLQQEAAAGGKTVLRSDHQRRPRVLARRNPEEVLAA